MTNSFGEFGKAKGFLVIGSNMTEAHLIGSNMTEAHPVAATFLKNAVLNGAKLIVIDPRHHRLCDFADLHLSLKRPEQCPGCLRHGGFAKRISGLSTVQALRPGPDLKRPGG
jgi:predicted molibdopterin-dependent oxidoreductase YjgC